MVELKKTFHSLELISCSTSLTFPDTSLFSDTSLLWLIANHDGEPNSIELKYLEEGHTFMRPNTTHGSRGDNFKKKYVHDWNELETLIESATKTNHVSILTLPKHL